LKYEAIKYRFSGPLLSYRCCHGNYFVPHLLGRPHVIPQSMNLIGPPVTKLLQFLAGFVTWPFHLEVIHVMPLGWSIHVPCLNWIKLTVLELGGVQFFIVLQLKVPIFTFFGGKWGQISNCIFLSPKRHFLGGNDANDVFIVGLCPKVRPVAEK